MCGITLTTCSKLIKSDSRMNPDIFQKTLDDIDNDVTLIDKLYQLSFNYKSDINFSFSRRRHSV